MRKPIALLVSFGVGFLSLSQEIVWVRIVSFMWQGRPTAFSTVLVAFLLGIAAGSMVGRRICARSSDVMQSAGRALMAAAAGDLVAIALCAYSALPLSARPIHLAGMALLIFACAALKGVLFPIVHHLGTDEAAGRVGRSVSHVYLGNVLGSTLGPIVTGYFLLDVLPVETVFALIAAGTAGLGVVTLAWGNRLQLRPSMWTSAAALLLATFAFVQWSPSILVHIAAGGRDGIETGHLHQNRQGVIHNEWFRARPNDIVTKGGNSYDGRISVDIVSNTNGLDRAYLMAALHPQPRRALVVGLSSGAWASVILGIPGIEAVDIVEINPAYLEMIADYPAVAPLLKDPRVSIHVDDGRRWLRSHPNSAYDLIFQNTTQHFRSNVTLLLSREYMSELRRHLKPRGIVAMNTTGSLDVYRTAIEVFPHALRYGSFVYMSDSALSRRADAELLLRACSVWGQSVFTDDLFDEGGVGHRLIYEPLETVAELLARLAHLGRPMVISDLNMVPEYRHGSGAYRWLRPMLPRDAGSLVIPKGQ